MQDKRGISPVIATTLLILVAVILAVIILLWVKSFLGEKVQKDIGGGPEVIDSFCQDVNFKADVLASGIVNIENVGDIPVYAIEVRKKGIASTTIIGIAKSTSSLGAVKSGETVAWTIQENPTLGMGNDLVLVPILLGTIEQNKKSYTCDEQYGVSVKVS